MNILCLLHILLAPVLYISTVTTRSISGGVETSINDEPLEPAKVVPMSRDKRPSLVPPPSAVVPFMEVYNKSMCQPREVLVDIMQEYPGDVEHTYIPSCVVVHRCGGCCNDEALECVAAETRNITLMVIQFRQKVSQHNLELSFTEHRKCRCRPKPEVKAKKENYCPPCSERRKRFYVQDALTCKCSCKFTQLDCKSRQLELNQRTCRCDKPRR